MTPSSTPPTATDRPLRNTLVILVTVVVALGLSILLPRQAFYRSLVGSWPPEARWFLQPGIWWTCMLVGAWRITPSAPRRLLVDLGLAISPRRIWVALAFTLMCSLPMLALGLASGVRAGQPASDLWNAAGIAAFAEETLFRGFAFGFLLLRARWKVWPAALLTGASFGAVHLVNASVRGLDPSGQLLTTGLIATGGIAYAWLHYRWRFNLWVPLGLHALMNLWWELFDVAQNPIGSTGIIVARVAVVTIAITWTEITYQRSKRADA